MGLKDYDAVRYGSRRIIAAYRGETQVFGGAVPVPAVPGQIDAGLWSVATGDDPGEIVVSITGLPSTGGSAITGLVYRIGTGAAQALGAGIGTWPITGLTPGADASVQIAAVNAVGRGPWATAKSATSGAAAVTETHVILLVGQSNMVGRADWDAGETPDTTKARQYARTGKISGGTDGQIVAWNHPLDHWDPNAGQMGLDTQFAIDYLAANPGVTLVLIPAARGGTYFATGQWGVGNTLYTDAVARINAYMTANPSAVLKGILWHQGESDGDQLTAGDSYQTALDAQFAAFRANIIGASASTPIVTGQMGTFASGSRLQIEDIIDATPNRIPYSSLVSSTGLTSKGDNLHFDAASLRTFGSRYFAALAVAAANTSPVATTPGRFSTSSTWWSVATGAGARQVDITISKLPGNGGSPITKLQYSVDGTNWLDLSGTTVGTYTVTMAAAATSYNIRLRAVNARGNGLANNTKAVTSGAETETWNVTVGSGTITVNTAPSSPATPVVASVGSGTITLSA